MIIEEVIVESAAFGIVAGLVLLAGVLALFGVLDWLDARKGRDHDPR